MHTLARVAEACVRHLICGDASPYRECRAPELAAGI
jgi:hypothetical protein